MMIWGNHLNDDLAIAPADIRRWRWTLALLNGVIAAGVLGVAIGMWIILTS